MAFFKYVFQFTQAEKGFAEIYYGSSDSLANAALIGDTIITNMCNLRPPITVLRKVRVSSVIGNRNSVVLSINRPGTYADADPDVAGIAAVCNLVSTSTGARRQLAIRGLSDEAVTRNAASGLDQPAARFKDYLTQFLRYLQTGHYMIQSLKKVGTSGIVKLNIVKINGVPNSGLTTVTTAGPMGISLPAQVQFTQVNQKDFPGLRGIFDVVSINGNDVVVRYNTHTAGDQLLTTGKLRNVQYEYGEIVGSLSKFSHFGTRDTGKNPLGGRGRRPGLRIRSL